MKVNLLHYISIVPLSVVNHYDNTSPIPISTQMHQRAHSRQRRSVSKQGSTGGKSKSGGSSGGGGGGGDDDGGGSDDGGDGDGDGHYPAIIFNSSVTINFYSSDQQACQQKEGTWHKLANWILGFVWDIFINILANIAATYLITLFLSLWVQT